MDQRKAGLHLLESLLRFLGACIMASLPRQKVVRFVLLKLVAWRFTLCGIFG